MLVKRNAEVVISCLNLVVDEGMSDSWHHSFQHGDVPVGVCEHVDAIWSNVLELGSWKGLVLLCV